MSGMPRLFLNVAIISVSLRKIYTHYSVAEPGSEVHEGSELPDFMHHFASFLKEETHSGL